MPSQVSFYPFRRSPDSITQTPIRDIDPINIRHPPEPEHLSFRELPRFSLDDFDGFLQPDLPLQVSPQVCIAKCPESGQVRGEFSLTEGVRLLEPTGVHHGTHPVVDPLIKRLAFPSKAEKKGLGKGRRVS